MCYARVGRRCPHRAATLDKNGQRRGEDTAALPLRSVVYPVDSSVIPALQRSPAITQASLKCACLIDLAAGSPSTSFGSVRRPK